MAEESSSGGTIAAGLALVVIAGACNGSWNASFNPIHGLAVGRKGSNQVDLSHHLAWLLFQVYSVVINIPVCLYWAGGPKRVQYIVQESSALEISMVCIFSLLWGVGSLGFGIACKIAGVGLGTNLCMGVIMVLGTFLPLCLEGAIATAAGGMVVAGLVVSCLGLALSVQSLQLRDAAERDQRIRRRTMYHNTVSMTLRNSVAAAVDESQMEESVPVEQDSASNTHTSEQPESREDPKVEPSTDGDEEGPSTFQKVAVCVIAGVFATQLQFAFVFGDEMIALAESNTGPGSTPPSGTSAVIWLFAISLGAPVSIIYGIYSNPPDIPLSRLYQCPWYRHVLLLLTTSVPWVSHIHLYGYANTYLPSDMAASVAWPILMMVTLVSGMIWSIGLGEWKWAPAAAKRKLYQGLVVVGMGVAVIMASVAI